MADPKLQRIFEAVDGWCAERGIPYDLVVDESDLQGYLLFKRHAHYLPRLTRFLEPIIANEGLHLRPVSVRGGTVLMLSVEAISEEAVADFQNDAGFIKSLDDVFDIRETQYNWSPHSQAANQTKTGNYGNYFGGDSTNPVGDAGRSGVAGQIDVAAPNKKRPLPTRRNRFRGRTPQRPLASEAISDAERRVRRLEGQISRMSAGPQRDELVRQVENARAERDASNGPAKRPAVAEDMGGLAAHHQPKDMLRNLDDAMRKMGLHAALQAAKISNKLSDDRQRIIFMIQDGQGAKRPIAAFDLIKLGEGNNLYQALDHLMDLSNQEAPGDGELQREKIKEKEQALRQIAKAHTPQDQSAADPGIMPAVESTVRGPFSNRVAAVFQD